MTLNPHTEEYYKKFIELQENLRKSEEERLKLEMKFHEMVRITKEETQIHYRKLRAHYKKFLDEDKRRQDRNDKILQNLERIEARLAMITAKTERFKWLRQQYRAVLDRIYKTKFDRLDYTPKEHQQQEQTQKVDRSDHFDSYLKNISTEQVKDRLGNNKITKILSDSDRNDDLSSFVDDEEYRPNFANSLVDEIVQTIDKLNKNHTNNDRTIVDKQFEKNPEINIGKLPRESTGSETYGEFSDKPDNDLEKSRIDDLPKVEQIQNKIDDLKIENVEQQPIENSKHNDDIVGKLEQIDTLPIEEINNRQEELQINESAVLEPTEINENCEPIEENQPNVIEISTTAPNKESISEIEYIAEDSEHDNIITEPSVNDNKENIVEKELLGDESCVDNKDDKKTLDKKENIEAANNNAECEQSLENISEQPNVPVETDTKIDPIEQVAITGEENSEQLYPQYSSEHQYENAQYDENGQLVPQFDEHGQLISQYDENGQLIPQYDQNGLLIPQFDENGQLIPQYDQNGQLIPQYDQYGQIIPQYDEHGQIIPQYDENGQLIQHYDEQYYNDTTNQQFENYPDTEQDETKPEQVENDGKSAEIVNEEIPIKNDEKSAEIVNEEIPIKNDEKSAEIVNEEIPSKNDEKSAEVADEETPKVVEKQEELKVDEKKDTVDDGELKQNVLEMLDTDTESVKQDTKISNDSDFDFSNS